MKFLISSLKQLLRQFKTATFINIVGLSVAFAVVVVVATQVLYDLNYDKGYKNAKEIVEVEMEWGGDWGWMRGMNWQLPEFWKERIPEIKDYALVEWWRGGYIMHPNDRSAEEASYEYTITRVSPGFLNVFTPEILAGDASRTFDIPGHAIISEKTARAAFGDENPVGQTLVDPESDMSLTIDAVYKDFPKNSTLENALYTYTDRTTPDGQNQWLPYFLIDPADREAVTAKMNDKDMLDELQKDRYDYEFKMLGMSELYLYGDGDKVAGHIGFTMYLAVIGLLVLVVAVINFINLSMAMGPSRVRTINIHKILGIKNGSMMLQLSLESVAVALVGVAFGCLVVHWFAASGFTDFFTANLALAANIPLLAGCVLGFLVIAFLVGFYGARYASSFDAAIALNSSFALGRKGTGLRNTLIVVQFVTAIFFICFSWFVKIQYDFMSNYQIGYEKENIVYVPIPARPDSMSLATMKQEIMKNPRITDFTASSIPGNLGGTWGEDFEGGNIKGRVWMSDHNTLDFFGVDVVAGDGFSDNISETQVIFNREMLRKYDLDESVIGKTFGDRRIVGIAEDVNFESLHTPISPMLFFYDPMFRQIDDGRAFIKISGDDVPATLDYIEKTWRELNPDESHYKLTFLDEQLDALYRRELNTSRLIGILGLIAVLIAVMGVFGLIMFNARYKRKEIAIRKVNGATIANVALMLNRNMLILLGVAFVLAVPLALVFIRRWVADFAHKAVVPWWLFLAAGLIVLLISVATVSWQSYRAASANPVKALKAE